jgi:hypothetical protein
MGDIGFHAPATQSTIPCQTHTHASLPITQPVPRGLARGCAGGFRRHAVRTRIPAGDAGPRRRPARGHGVRRQRWNTQSISCFAQFTLRATRNVARLFVMQRNAAQHLSMVLFSGSFAFTDEGVHSAV